MSLLTLKVEADGQRADQLLTCFIEDLTRSAAQRLLEEGRVTIDGKVLKKNARPTAGQIMCVDFPDPEPSQLLAQDIPLDIVYEDEDVIVINKPVGMVVHPAPGHPDSTLVNALLYHCGDHLSHINGEFRPGIVHRIDRDTSGLLVAAKNDKAHIALAAQLEDHSLSRIYECVTMGSLREDEGTIDAPMGRHPVDRKRMAVIPHGKRAVTHYTVLNRYSGFTHAQCRLETGRTHQIRVHMAYIGHPLLGDGVYGGREIKSLAGQCLHARQLTFVHPRTGERMTVEAPLPDWFTAILNKLERGQKP